MNLYNVINVDSIGNAIFLAGKNRYACKHSTFMFHGVGFDIQNTRLEEKNLRETMANLLSDQNRIGGVIADETSLETKDIHGLFREAQTKDATFALEKSIVQEIRDACIPEGAPLIQLVFQR